MAENRTSYYEYILDGTTAKVTKTVYVSLTEPVKVYNFEVEDYHTYYVESNGILVHNECTPAKSSIKNSKALVKEADKLSGRVQDEINSLAKRVF